MRIFSTIKRLGACATGITMAAVAAVSCTGLIFDDRDGCEHGVYLSFRYDYNLQRADMFGDHVGEVTVYVFDEQGNYVTSQTEGNTADARPLAQDGYRMYLDLPEGTYRFIALAQQDSYSGTTDEPGAQYIREEPGEDGRMEDLAVSLEFLESRASGDTLTVNHEGQPLDTLWHSMTESPVTVKTGATSEAELSLTRNTKYITVTLYDLDHPDETDVEDFDFEIIGHSGRTLYDNSADETSAVRYTPFATWNSSDREPSTGSGSMAHAEFMTSRIIYHDDPQDDSRLKVMDRETGRTVIDVDLADLLSRMANYDELQRYSPQEFLDRGYDYNLSFYISGTSWSYVNITIGVLGWSKRIQNVSL